MQEYNQYFESNKSIWNQRTAVHKDSAFYNLDGFKKGEPVLTSIELNELGDLRGKKILHLQCHFGMDSLDLARMGAKVTGVDLSDVAIREARQLNEELGLDAKFICCNVYDLKEQLDEKFDIVFTTENRELIVVENEGTYTDREADIQGKEYSWNHSISEVLNALIKANLELEFFNEYMYSPYPCFRNVIEIEEGKWQIKGLESKIPMVYSLQFNKP